MTAKTTLCASAPARSSSVTSVDESITSVRVRTTRWEAEGVISVELERPDGGPLPGWQPGAHVDLRLPNGLVRQYSLCGEPASPSWRIAVLHEPGRGGSTYVHTQLRPGDIVDIAGPRNHFALQDSTEYLFIAGGIGITPILPMVRACATTAKEWTLVYGGRSRASMTFLDELATYGSRVHVVPQDEQGLLDLRSVIGQAPAGSLVYCCGPEGLLEAVIGVTAETGLDCHVERFAPVISAAEAREGDAFDVVLKRSGLTVTVHDGESILDVVERAGLNPPFSCREGTCGSCETGVISGTVDHRDGILTEDERNDGASMMICVSRSTGAALELDL